MRLSGPLFGEQDTPEKWVALVRQHGYGAARAPVKWDTDETVIREYAEAAERDNIVIPEVGAFGVNPISPDEEERKAAVRHCQRQLELADKLGARCCTNIAGARGQKWNLAYPENFSQEAFDLTVESVREIIDRVAPTRTYYALETMPWVFPESADSYVALIKAIDRRRFAVHLDPVNLIFSPRLYFNNAAVIRECFDKLGPHIRSCHAKDTLLTEKLTVCLQEVRPGLGALDYDVYLTELSKLGPDVALVMEHMKGAEEYAKAAEHLRSVAARNGLEFVS